VVGRAILAATVVASSGCLRQFGPPSPGAGDCSELAETATTEPTAIEEFDKIGADFFAAPFPALGRPYNGEFPATSPLEYRMRTMVSSDSYATSAALFFELSWPVLPGVLPPQFTLPDAGADTGAEAGTDAGDAGSSPVPGVLVFPRGEPKNLWPVNVDVSTMTYPPSDGATAITCTILTALPVQGRPLRENTTYVAVVTTRVAKQGQFVKDLCAGKTPAGISNTADAGQEPIAQQYRDAINQDLLQFGLSCGDVAAISLFNTSNPTQELNQVRQLAHADYMKSEGACPRSRFALTRDTAPDGQASGPRCPNAPFCVYRGSVQLPDYQRGTPPYLPYIDWGGGWPQPPVPEAGADPPGCVDNLGSIPEPADPKSWTPTWRTARVIVTIPRAPPPTLADGTTKGYPVVVLVRAGAGTTTDPLVDRGPILGADCAETACRGPAEVLQSVGFAGITIDGPLVGISGSQPIEFNEDFGIFDFLNPQALVDNIRQSAVELTLIPDILSQLTIDPTGCDGVPPGQVTLDTTHIAMFSHSMGSSISPLALAAEPRYGAAILSGSGGSLIENAMYKTQPLPITAASVLYGYSAQACMLRARDPQLSLLQWATEPADSQVYARRMLFDDDPPASAWVSPNARSALMIQGLVDHYILPPIADTMTLGEGLDLGVGPNSCNDAPSCDLEPVYGDVASPEYPTLPKLLPLSGRGVQWLADAGGGNTPWPASVDGGTHPLTGLVVQHRIDENREPGACTSVDGHEVIYESTLARHQYACFLQDFLNDRAPQVRTQGGEFDPCDP